MKEAKQGQPIPLMSTEEVEFMVQLFIIHQRSVSTAVKYGHVAR